MKSPYPPIGDYALIGDCHSAALVSREGSIDWCCLPRFDAGSAFGRLLDWNKGGFCKIAPTGADWDSARSYLDRTLVLETVMRARGAEASVLDCLLISKPPSRSHGCHLLRVIEGRRGSLELELAVSPRFDYGHVTPWLRRHGPQLHSATGGNDAILVWCDEALEEASDHSLGGRVRIGAGERVRLSMRYVPPELIEDADPPDPETLDRRLEETIHWWREWTERVRLASRDEPAARRSAIVLKALTYAPTGAVIAAPTTSLPEAVRAGRNWDYRYAWIRDASFSSRAFAELGCVEEADAFKSFIVRSAAGHADELQVVYGVGGERRLRGEELEDLDGYRGATPVRVGNDASGQRQLDAYGELVNLTWRWHRRGHSPTDDDWRFLVSLLEHTTRGWSDPDHGIWEWPGDPDHFVHSKVMCWSALDRGIKLADECMRRAPTRRWAKTRDQIRRAVERRGYDRKRGVFVQAFDRTELDASLLLLPRVEFLAWDDERMLRTVEAIRDELGAGDGLLFRYRRDDGLDGSESAFLCCSFWLVECLARAGELVDAREVFDAAVARANDLGLLAEEVDPATDELAGNFPQALTHLSHIDAAVALAELEPRS